MSAVSFNLANYNRAATEQSRRPTNSVGGFYGQKPAKLVGKEIVNGQCQDKLTSNQLKPELHPHATTYNDDYTGSLSSSGNKKQQLNKQQKGDNRLPPSKVNNGSQGGQNVPQAGSVKNVPNQTEANVNNQASGNVRINQANEILKQQNVQPAQLQSSQSVSGYGNSRKFDTTSMYDPEAVHDDIKKSYLSNPNIKVDNEAEYYETVRRLDVCGRCWTGQQKYCTAPFKLKEKGPSTTLYQKDYVKHPIDRNQPEIKNDFYNTFNIEEPIDFNTTHKNDYKAHKIEPVERHNQNKAPKAGVPFAGRAGSKADYINWGNIPVNYEKAPNNISVIPELPFMAKTSYGDNFGNKFPYEKARPVDRDLWKNKGKSPLSPGIPFLAQTTSQRAFKPFKVEGSQMAPKKNEFEPVEPYPEQYTSIYNQDYTQHRKDKCPARVFLDTHPHPRSKYLDV